MNSIEAIQRVFSQKSRRSIGELGHVVAFPHVHECKGCGLFQSVPALDSGQVAYCPRCGHTLSRRRHLHGMTNALAFCISAALLFALSVTCFLLSLDVYGHYRSIDLMTGPIEFFREGWRLVGALVALVTIVAPAVTIGLVFVICHSFSHEKRRSWLSNALFWYERIRPWSMIEVYILGIFVAYTKLTEMAYVTLDSAVYTLFLLMVVMVAIDLALDKKSLWELLPIRAEGAGAVEVAAEDNHALPPPPHMFSCRCCGLVMAVDHAVEPEEHLGDCPRCGHLVRRRKKDVFNITVACLFSALVLYIPANLYSVMNFVKMGSGGGHTIIAGVIELWQADMVPLSLLVFFASISVPVFKIAGLTSMLVTARYGFRRGLVVQSKLYRVIDVIGRWSMIDVFMISIMIAVVRFDSLANITADPGVMAFAAVVVLTIFAANSFDPRIMWDAAGLNDRIADMSICAKRAGERPARKYSDKNMEPV